MQWGKGLLMWPLLTSYSKPLVRLSRHYRRIFRLTCRCGGGGMADRISISLWLQSLLTASPWFVRAIITEEYSVSHVDVGGGGGWQNVNQPVIKIFTYGKPSVRLSHDYRRIFRLTCRCGRGGGGQNFNQPVITIFTYDKPLVHLSHHYRRIFHLTCRCGRGGWQNVNQPVITIFTYSKPLVRPSHHYRRIFHLTCRCGRWWATEFQSACDNNLYLQQALGSSEPSLQKNIQSPM